MTTIIDTERAAFHAERLTGIGGSDVAAILGLSNYASPWSVWARLVGLLPASEEETQRQRIGHELEGAIVRLFTAETDLHIAGEQMAVRHRRHPWARGFVDGLVFEHRAAKERDIDLALGGFEAKTDGRFGWPHGIPPSYQAQAQWYMLVTGLQHWWFGVLFAGFRFEVFELAANPADQALIARRAARLWHRHVLTGTPPPVDGSDATAEALRTVYPEHEPGERASLDNLAGLLPERTDIKTRMKADKARLAEIDNQIREAFGGAEVGTVDGIPVLSYRSSERAGYVVEPTTVRTLRAATKKDIAS